ncbi:uncharacterized protein LOC131147987 isoform X2 [Malania oleifera]|uniref:uncharacterized protein LOC131147987 isoform X2 n=1 Tax=Malania oleifera TaxID=397392 RepID=UPI0025AEA5CE|nr:uncharacterized protein LOC131147987 isoform X2 [Malania oleifera]
MEKLPESRFVDASRSAVPSTSGAIPPGGNPGEATAQQLIAALQEDQYREHALHLLSKNRGICANLALLLWNSFGTIFILLQEVMATYRILSNPDLIARVSNRVCNALVLLQCIASHPETRKQFIKANIPLYLYPFLGTMTNQKHIEYLRLTSLGVVGALVKVDDAEVIHFLLKSEIFPYCLRCMEVGKELSKTVATFIVQRILMHEEGLKYCCSSAERFFAVSHVLRSMVENPAEEPSPRLLKHIIRCYLIMSESPRACDGLRGRLPPRLKDNAVISMLHLGNACSTPCILLNFNLKSNYIIIFSYYRK